MITKIMSFMLGLTNNKEPMENNDNEELVEVNKGLIRSDTDFLGRPFEHVTCYGCNTKYSIQQGTNFELCPSCENIND